MQTLLRDPIRLEELESRIVPTLPLPGPMGPVPLPYPNPIVPGPGDTQILANVLTMSVANRPVLDHLPVPYVIDVSATNPTTGQVVTSIVEGQAHTPIKIDADQSKTTGKGGSGFDIQVEIDAYVDPTPHLVMTVDRLGNGPYAQNLSVVVAVPFAGFDLEPGLPGTPNLVMGFQTRGPGNTVGGHAPLEEVMTLTPGTLAGTSHSFQASMATTGADNPLSFILGNLDGTNVTGTLNAAGLRAYVENVPATINLNVATMESALGGGAINSSFALNWQASAASFVQLDYLENVTNPHTASGPDFNTSLTANPMPTNEQFALAVNEAAGTATLSQHANAAVTQMTFQKTRSDGLAVVGNGSNVPTQTDLTLNLAGSATLTDNANVGSLAMQAAKTGGFAGSSAFLGYHVATAGIAVSNAPSLSAAFAASGTTRTFTAAPAVAGNAIGGVALLASSDSPTTVQLPTRWSNPAWDVLSMVDTGTGDTSMPPVFAPGATAAARLLNLVTGSWTLTTAPLGIAFDVTTTTATPLQAYLRTTPTSLLIPGHDDEITCELVNIPAGETKFFFHGPTSFGVSTTPPASIADIHLFGHIDSLTFDIDAGGVPPVFAFTWDPDSMLTILAQDGHGGNAFLGHLSALLADTNGISLFPDAGTLFGTKLKEARLRVDNIPTFTGTWVVNDASGNTSIQYNTVAPGLYAGGVQMAVSTHYNDPALANPLPPAGSVTADFATFNDAGAAARNMLIGVLGIDSFTDTVANATDMVHIIWDDNDPVPFNLNVNSITGGVYFAGAHVYLNNNIALVPTHLDYETDLDPMVCYTGTNFIPSIDLTFDHNQGLPAGSTLTVHADNLPPVLCFDFEAAAGTVTVLAQDTMGNNDETIGDLSFDLEDPSGLPGTSSLLGAPIEQAGLRLDNVPSFQATFNTTATGTTIGLQSVAPGLSIGGTQLQISTQQDLAPLGPPAAGSADVVTLSAPGAGMATHLIAELFGLTQFTYSTDNTSNTTTMQMVQDVARPLTATVVSTGGPFFPGHTVDAVVAVHLLPQSITLSSNFSTHLSYTASSGIGSITVGGSTGPQGTFDTTTFSLSATSLPAVFGFDLDPLSHLTISAETVGLFPDTIGNITAHLHNPNGLGGGAPLLGDPVRDIRIRADSIPSLHATWSTTSGTAINISADNAGTFLGGVQVALSSTENDTVPPIVNPATGPADYVKLDDEGTGGVKRLAVGLFGVGAFSFTTQDASHGITVHYAADAAEEMQINLDSAFGYFFSTYTVHAALDIQDLPATWDFNSDFATVVNYTGAAPIHSIMATADIDKTANAADNTHAIFMADGLPAAVNFTLDPNSSATLTMSDAITQIMFSATSDNTILGTGTYKLIQANLNDIPAHWSVNWSGGQLVVAAMDTGDNPAPMGQVAATISTSDVASDNAAFLMPFQTSGPGGARINYSPFLRDIDDRFYGAIPGGASATLAAINAVYNNAQVLTSGEDHAVATMVGGNLKYFDGQFTGFQNITFQPNANGGHFEFDAPTPGPHPFFAGVGMDSNFLYASIENVPASATLDIDLGATTSTSTAATRWARSMSTTARPAWPRTATPLSAPSCRTRRPMCRSPGISAARIPRPTLPPPTRSPCCSWTRTAAPAWLPGYGSRI